MSIVRSVFENAQAQSIAARPARPHERFSMTACPAPGPATVRRPAAD
jgi:hypothetical protein